ncbi:AHH domain-containing protein [Erythrobacter rubeus]|uniref:AHH domain-containing protein n=1 Tax=Erythrobacter rubeus TaxID=2760803 RepID=A0ABR8KRD2_9SPHN|nr:AHH domain-containing protein [Erythrobacter rubeus]MBD2841972.1 AHH domain-containing protein [Erythrobacter rubeus]
MNQRRCKHYDPSLQRHHILPRQLLSQRFFGVMFDQIGRASVGFDDFRTNGLLLPATESATLRTGLPLHRGPHRRYNEIVIDRVGCVERDWSLRRAADPARALFDAVFRLTLLQSALRRRLLTEQRRFVLNKKDPLGTGFDFRELDAMAETLWSAT